ncbi:hypothetical protein SAMN04487917_101263 [Arthrobacter sp. yr096]|uniref:DUF2264 domain-containing protein n=1 Tax=Arthrobacter sp. yr096 TaxID=1761750 RepID=UPI0008C25C5F|nr:DUF2264 domain-containing protein [Arthrobacter sp. yr096]SEI43427.1 hypothetical protein SAMN04487917_101263 [Arthrobacter sp. yr096]
MTQTVPNLPSHPRLPWLPTPDPVQSPFTGWTRGHWEATADHWLEHIRDYSSPLKASPRLPGPVTRDGERREGMETIGRSLLMAAPRIAGARGEDRLGLAAWYREALLAGTDPEGAERWPLGVTCKSPLLGVTNSIVEAANIAFSLFVGREWLWEPLTAPEKKQVAGWLRHHARLEVWGNNWQLFPAMAEGFLRSVGEDVSGCTGARNVARVESWYLGDGWYTDGPEHSIDYYNAWAIHPYLWAWYKMTGREDTPEGRRHLERLREFVGTQSLMFASDGAVLHVGRSLAYRTAVLAAMWCAEISGVNPLTPGATRRLASGVLANFTARGVGVEGPPNLGWYDEHVGSCQAYSGFGSPYLAGIGFLGLALPPEHRVWQDAEEAQPTDGPGVVQPLPDAGWTMSTDGGLVRLTNHGSDHCGLPVGGGTDPDDPHYAKFSYSTHTAPGTGAAWEDNVDGHLALLGSDGVASRRCALRATRTDGLVSGSVHIPQLYGKTLPGTAVTTVSAVDGIYELRCHLVCGPVEYSVREGGHAVAGNHPGEAGLTGDTSWVNNGDVFAAVTAVHGWEVPGTTRYTDANAMGKHSTVPSLSAQRRGEETVHVALHALTRGPAPAPAELKSAAAVVVSGTEVSVRWASGTSQTFDLRTFVPWDGQVGK